MKQTKLWLATIAMLSCGISASAHSFVVDGIYYNITSSTDLTVSVTYRGSSSSDYSNEYSGAVTIPSTVTYNGNTYSVTSIGSSAFSGCSSLTAITIPESMTSIGSSAFYNCSSLTAITIPEGVTRIGDYAFDNCTALKEVIFEDGSETLSLGYNYYSSNTGQGLFYDCPLESVYLGRNLSYSSGSSYGSSPFYNKTKLTSVVIGDGVTSIGLNAFYGCSNLTAINIPEGVTSIGDCAFAYCSSLTAVHISDIAAWCNIKFEYYESNPLCYAHNLYLNGELVTQLTIPEGVTSIGSSAFYNCISLTSITLPESVTSIGYGAFSGCTSLTTITLPEGVTSIEDYAFEGCSSLTSITLPEGVTSIEDYAFEGCSSLTSITLPEGVTSIGSSAFYNCISLTSITLPESVTSIKYAAFDNCTALKEVIFEDGSETLSLGCNEYYSYGTGQGLFYDCPLESVYLGRNLSYSGGSSYGYSPFYNKTELYSVIISDSAVSIGERAFADCTIEKLNVNCNIPSTSSSYYSAFYGSNFTIVIIGDKVTTIGNYAFYGCDIVKTIWKCSAMPNGYSHAKGKINYTSNRGFASDADFKVYPLLNSMFEVDGITYIPVSLSERTCDIANYTYDDPPTVLTIGESVSYRNIDFKIQEINPYAFYKNNHITEVSIANNGSVGAYAFSDCDSLCVVSLFNKGNIGNYAFSDCVALSDITLGSGISAIGGSAFSGCTSLAAITLPDRVTSIGNYAFEDCTALTGLTLPPSVTSVGYAPFTRCNALTSLTVAEGNTKYDSRSGCNAIVETATNTLVAATNVTTIPGSVTKIGSYAFNGCEEMTDISIPKAVTMLCDHAFQGCSKLANVSIEDRAEALALGSNGNKALFADCPLNTVYIGGKITYNTSSSKGYSPFSGNTSLIMVTITSKEEEIYDYEFYGCVALKNVSIGHGVTTIGDYAFSNCSSLEKFTFGASVESIGTSAFAGCTKMSEIVSSAGTPPICGSMALDDIDKWQCTLKVPVDNASAYATADQWKEFLFVEDNVVVDRYDITYYVDGEVYYSESLIYNETIVLPDTPAKEGHTFNGWGDVPTRMPDGAVEVHATFTPNNYIVTFKANGIVVSSEPLPYGGNIVTPEAPEMIDYTFVEWADLLETVPAHDVEFIAVYKQDVLLIADDITSFCQEENALFSRITYTRNFKNTNWQALYVPFEIPYEVIKDDFAVAYINDVHQFDDDDNGTIDRTRVEAIKVTDGVLKANYPYMIRAKVAGEKTITVTDATLYATEENSIDCSSVFDTYTFTGTYSKIPAAELPKEGGYYALSGGSWKQFSSGATSSLGAFRIYMKIDSRDANAAIAGRAIEMRVIGDDEEETTGMEYIESTVNSQQSTAIYDLQGRRVEHPVKGLYIVNGEKVWIK